METKKSFWKEDKAQLITAIIIALITGALMLIPFLNDLIRRMFISHN